MRIVVTAMSMMMLFSAAGLARADTVEAAKKAISKLSDEEVLAEFQRRFEAKCA